MRKYISFTCKFISLLFLPTLFLLSSVGSWTGSRYIFSLPEGKTQTAEKDHLHKSLLQIPHDFLPDCPLHAEVALDVLDVVLRQGLAIVDLQQQLNNTSLVCAKQCSNNSSQKHWVTFAGDHPAMHSQRQSRRLSAIHTFCVSTDSRQHVSLPFLPTLIVLKKIPFL